MYSIKTESDCKKTAKGIKKSVINQEIAHDDYRNTLFRRFNTLFNKTSMMLEMNVIRSLFL